MSTNRALAPAPVHPGLPRGLDRRFEAVLFDWDGTAVPDRVADARRVRRVVEALAAQAVELVVITGTHLRNVDDQLRARPRGPGRLLLCVNRGSEVFEVARDGPRLVERRVATEAEETALSDAARRIADELLRAGVETEIVSDRLNRRKIDLIPTEEWRDPPKARISELVDAVERRLRRAGIASLGRVVERAHEAAAAAGLPQARVTSDAKHVEIGLTDKADAARAAFAALAERGIAPADVLVVGDELGPLGGVPGSDSLLMVPEGAGATVASVGAEPLGVPPGVILLRGGPDAFVGLLEDQLARRGRGELPAPTGDPGWTVEVRGIDAAREAADAARLSFADGRLGTRGSVFFAHPATRPLTVAAGAYAGEGAEQTLRAAPLWTQLERPLSSPRSLRRVLDLRTGILHQTVGGEAAALAFSSLAEPGTGVLRAVAHGGPGLGGLFPLAPTDSTTTGACDGASWAVAGDAGDGVAAIASDVRHAEGDRRLLDRIACFEAHPPGAFHPSTARRTLRRRERCGFEGLLSAHRSAWARRWRDCSVEIHGDDELTHAVRFALFHLIGAAADDPEAAVGARNLTGTAYRGHVFWDADVFVLPFFAATHPPAARAMLEYRLRRLHAAHAHARALGFAGARFPWESAATGLDVTPSALTNARGEAVPVLTGEQEEHVVADVAWAAARYADWTGDRRFARGPLGRLLVETARYWASRIRVDDRGAHIDHVIGPDEYHEGVDDNAYTNGLARWNLRRAAEVAGVPAREQRRWLELADALVDGYDPVSGLYEQFAGFFALEPLVIADHAPRPIGAETALGRERVAAAQVVKQPDVLMLHHVLPGEVVPGSLVPNLAFYEPRTSHGSSLSPGVHAALFARAGEHERALEYLRLAARLDLDDVTGSTANGLHLAAMGSVWQALVQGFAGIRATHSALALDPRLPPSWDGLGVRLRFRGRRLGLQLEHDAVTIDATAPVRIELGGEARSVAAGRTRLAL